MITKDIHNEFLNTIVSEKLEDKFYAINCKSKCPDIKNSIPMI